MDSLPDKWFLSICIPEFPAQVAACWDYDLWNKAYVITRQSISNDRSVVISVSERACRRGIYVGIPLKKVKMKYRDVKILRENVDLEKRARKEIIHICGRYTPEVLTRSSPDIITLNLTGGKLFCGHHYWNLASIIHTQIRDQIGFKTICMGSANTIFIATLCAQSARPNQIKKCEKGCEPLVLADINARLLPDLSKETRDRLRNLNLKTIRDIWKMSKNFLITRLGYDGEKLYGMIRGLDVNRMKKRQVQRVQSDVEFTVNTNNVSALHSAIQYIADQLSFKLRQHKTKTQSITEILVFSDNKTNQKTHRMGTPTWNYTDIFPTAMNLFPALFTRRVAVRSIKLRSGRLFAEDGQQELFESPQEKRNNKVAEALDTVRSTFGFNAIQNAEVISFLHDNQ